MAKHQFTQARFGSGAGSSRVGQLKRLKSLLAESIDRIGCPIERVADLHGFDDLVALSTHIDELRRQLDLPRIVEWKPVRDRKVYSVKVWDPARPGGKGVHAVVYHGFELGDRERSTNAVNIPSIIDYLQRSSRFVEGEITEAGTYNVSLDGPARWLRDVIWVASAGVSSTKGFRDLRHDDLVGRLQMVLEERLPESPRIYVSQSLQDRGCDLVIEWINVKSGVQLKSDGDVEKDDFASKTLAQIQDSRQHGLSQLYVVVAADITTESNLQKVRGMMSRISAMNDPYVVGVPPEQAWRLLLPENPERADDSV